MYKICLVEDEKNLNDLIKSYLERAGYEVTQYYNGTDALNHVTDKVNLWILDIMLGDEISGYQDLDKIIGLELGSDDYVTKPYSPKELVLRVNNIIKRAYMGQTQKIMYDTYEIDIDKRLVKDESKELSLTTLEFDLLLMLVQNKNKSFSRSHILETVWGDNYFGSDRVVDDLVRRLRKKMPKLRLNTIYGYGYRLS